MGIPPRHGVDLDRQGPSPAEPTGGPIPSKQLGAFFEDLPPQALQFFAHSGDMQMSALNLFVGNSIELCRLTVPNQQAFVVTDVQYYGLVPSRHFNAPLLPLQIEQLVHLIRFELVIEEYRPMRLDGAHANTVAVPPGDMGPLPPVNVFTRFEGWPFVELAPTSDRGMFALYAKSRANIVAKAWVEALPRFWLSKLGVRITGYTVSEQALESAIKKAANR